MLDLGASVVGDRLARQRPGIPSFTADILSTDLEIQSGHSEIQVHPKLEKFGCR
jgi:hypothetical protein